MATISLILGIISVALSWITIWGLVVAIFCVMGTAILKRRKEYGKNKMAMKSVALVLAITGLVISIFVTGLNVTKGALVNQTNKAALDDVMASVSTATLMQAQQQASYAWNEARMKGYREARMEQYIFASLQNSGIDTTNFVLEITTTGVEVKLK